MVRLLPAPLSLLVLLRSSVMRNASFHLKHDFSGCERLETDEQSRLQFRVSTFPLNCVIIALTFPMVGGGGDHMTPSPVAAETTAITTYYLLSRSGDRLFVCLVSV